ncbi:hypothetical protein MKK88_03510, partial [Methylobacterium sp. E-005]|uniref:hypothetical protein n=1 Tax=Methylobacterium sp. E-005 TaxID=2836549 RepID=UPI001FB94686
PCEIKTSTCRSLATISSAVCFFRPMTTSSTWLKAIPQGGPLFRGQASGDSFGSFKDVPHFQLPDSYKSNAGAYGAAKTSALDAVKSGARAASANASLAQSLLTQNSVTNHGAQDNSSRTETQYNGDFHFHGVQDPKGMMAELKRASVGSRSFTAAADYGTA